MSSTSFGARPGLSCIGCSIFQGWRYEIVARIRELVVTTDEHTMVTDGAAGGMRLYVIEAE
ncbi:hypothetical protein L21SP2_0984 [Salinispira pacifica]|uniref:Uncharacterized protein n=1 Tax=Salinispira pacifica TaxID=1307761 RepID=V5WF24_9SPIO|nr:hypothetical protein L21SP2_0984 [Salinispira pacifica]